MSLILIILHIIFCIALIMIVLLQTGKGADIGATFGGGGSQTLFGSTGASTFLSKATTAAAVLFMLTSLTLAYMSGHRIGDSIMTDVDVPRPPSASEEAAPPQPSPTSEAVQPESSDTAAVVSDGETSSDLVEPVQTEESTEASESTDVVSPDTAVQPDPTAEVMEENAGQSESTASDVETQPQPLETEESVSESEGVVSEPSVAESDGTE